MTEPLTGSSGATVYWIEQYDSLLAANKALRAKLAEEEKDTQRLRLAIEPAWREGYDAGVDDATSFEWGHRKSTPYETSEAFDAARQKEEAKDG